MSDVDPPRWRLDTLPAGPGADEVLARGRAFARLDVASIDAGELAAALDELGALRGALQLHSARVELPLVLDRADADAAESAAQLDELLAEVEASVRPFELAWTTLAPDRAAALLGDVRLARHRHHLERMRQFAGHLLADDDEWLLGTRDAAAEDAWQRLYELVTSTAGTPRAGGEVGSLNAAIDELRSASAQRRRDAMGAIRAAVGPQLEVLACCLDALIADRLAVDEVRGFTHPRAQTDLENDVSSTTVDALLAAVGRHRPLLRRWNAAKAELLGLDELGAHDEPATPPGLPALDYEQALGLVADAFGTLHPQLGALVRELQDRGRIDAGERPRKRGVATCISAGAGTLPFVSLTFRGEPGDTLTLAHELGHALHYALAARRQSALDYEPPPPVAETAAVFAELLVLDRLGEQDREARATAAAHRMDALARNVFRQVMITRFEAAAYAARAQGEPLTAPRLAELWLRERRWLHGDAPIAADDVGWALVPHVVHHRFYNHAYAIAGLTATGLLGLWHADPAGFGNRYVEFLATGGAAPLPALLTGLGLDPHSSWDEILGGVALGEPVAAIG